MAFNIIICVMVILKFSFILGMVSPESGLQCVAVHSFYALLSTAAFSFQPRREGAITWRRCFMISHFYVWVSMKFPSIWCKLREKP